MSLSARASVGQLVGLSVIISMTGGMFRLFPCSYRSTCYKFTSVYIIHHPLSLLCVGKICLKSFPHDDILTHFDIITQERSQEILAPLPLPPPTSIPPPSLSPSLPFQPYITSILPSPSALSLLRFKLVKLRLMQLVSKEEHTKKYALVLKFSFNAYLYYFHIQIEYFCLFLQKK